MDVTCIAIFKIRKFLFRMRNGGLTRQKELLELKVWTCFKICIRSKGKKIVVFPLTFLQKIGKNFNYFFLFRLCTRQESHISNPEMANIRACRVKSGNTSTFFLALEQIKCSTTK